MRHCLPLDLQADAELIEQYEAFHRAVWPEVIAHLRQHRVLGMEIFRLGTRLVMIMETDDTRFDSQRMAAAASAVRSGSARHDLSGDAADVVFDCRFCSNWPESSQRCATCARESKSAE